MCGILGSLPNVDKHHFKNALDELAHRGPDDSGISTVDNEIILGHRRLSILDTSNAGHQPMSYENGDYWIVFNGEIYNFIEIRKNLLSLGYSFHSQSDTEVVIAAFIEYGTNCFNMFNGMWAMAIWEKKTKTLLLSRDRFGKKPLFYSHNGDQFVFASEMKAIMKLNSNYKVSNNFSFFLNNIYSYESSEMCLIENIKRFPPGSFGFLKNGKLTIKKYWNTLENLVDIPNDYKNQVEQFRELFFDSVKIRMRSDVSLGTTLSGGLDSSSVISAMHAIGKTNTDQFNKNWQHAFVATFNGSFLDEEVYAKKILHHLNIKGNFLNINPLEYIDNLPRYLYLFEEIYPNSPIPMIAIYNKVKQNGVSVSLDGHGADELLSGYGHVIHAIYDANFNIKKIYDIVLTYKQGFPTDSPIFLENWILTLSKFISKNMLLKILNKNTNLNPNNLHGFDKLDHLNQELFYLAHSSVMPTLLRNYDRYSMASGVEVRMPFLDHRIVSFLFSIPYSSKIEGGYTKKILRDAMAPYMVDEITYRKSKIGFNTPILEWMQGDLKSWFGDILHSKEFMECDLVTNPAKTKNSYEKIISGKNDSFHDASMVWTEITPYLWEQAFLKRKTAF